MILLTPELHARLRANADAHRLAQSHADQGSAEEIERHHDPFPVVKFFNPMGAATWLFTELDSDNDTLFGLCDLGFGTPEPGYASLSEIASVHLPGGLGIERDLCFEGRFPLSVYAEAARVAGCITEAERLLATLARARQLMRSPASGQPLPDQPDSSIPDE